MASRKRTFVMVFPSIYRDMFGVECVYKVRATSEEGAQLLAQSMLDAAIGANAMRAEGQ